MLKTHSEHYRSHHADIREILVDIKKLLSVEDIQKDAEAVAHFTRQLTAKFTMHLALEDKSFYPRAMKSNHAKLSQTAKDFQDEMGGLRLEFDQYRSKWPGPFAISKDPETFVKETKATIKKLEYRLEREETELYNLFDEFA